MMKSGILLCRHSAPHWLAEALATWLLGLVLSTASAGVTNDFVGGLGQRSDIVDAYPGMAGDGWVDGWTFGPGSSPTGVLVDAGVTNTAPLAEGGDYFRYAISWRESAVRRRYTNTADLDLSLPHYIEFDLRCDDWLPSQASFSGSSDQITLTARPSYANNPSGDSTYYIRAQGANDSSAPNARKNFWGFFDGGEFSSANDAGTFTNYFPFRIGTNYHFKIEQRPVTKTYVVHISAVVDGAFTNLTTKELRWRSYATVSAANQTNSTVLHFISRPSDTSTGNEIIVMALDNLHIYQAPLDEVAPLVKLVSPSPGAVYYATNSPVSFEVRTLGSTNWIPDANIQLTLNGVDVSGALTLGGSGDFRTASYSGFEEGVIYRGVIVAADQAGRSTTNSFYFDTLVESHVLTLEAENYNFGTNSTCAANGTPTVVDGGDYLQNPLPSTYNNNTGIYTNQETGYVDRVGQPGVDFNDFWTVAGSTSSNVFRFCDPVGTAQTTDFRRPVYITEGVPDYTLQHIQLGDWLNYTHDFSNSSYRVYLRVASSALQPQEIKLARVTSNRRQPNQTTSPAGTFDIPYTGDLNTFAYVPLTDAVGNPLLLPLNGETTLRLTATKVTGSMQVNFILFVPESAAAAPPWLLQVSPSPNAVNVAPQTAISLIIQNGSAPVDTGTIVLKVNGSNVTTSAVITPTATGATVSYLPPVIFPMGSLNTVQVTFGDGMPATLQTNEWSFTAGALLPGQPVRVNFQTPTFAPTPAGYLPDIGMVFGNRGNGYNYGWDQDLQGQARDRGTSGSPPDDRYRTLNQLGNTANLAATRFWEIELPNGTYNVHLVAGDGSAVDSVYNLAVEGSVIIASNTPTAQVHWFEGTNDIVVADGRLTITAAGGINNKVCFIDIIPAGPPLDLTLHDPAASGPTFSFNLATVDRVLYLIEYKNDLSDATWQPLTSVVGNGGVAVINDAIPEGGKRLYRMRIQ